MVLEIIQSAIARKMLCSPVNSLIADTELLCAAGVLLRLYQVPEAEVQRYEGLSNADLVRRELLTLLEQKGEESLDERGKRLAEMCREYRGASKELMPVEYRKILRYGYETPLVYPQMKN